MFGMMQSQKTCESCKGRGKIIKEPCDNCRGTGNIRVLKKLDVTIPAGVDEGGRICLRGQGNAGVNGGGYGDLYIVVSLRQHELFERSGNDLYCEIPVSYAELALGAELDIPTLSGTVKYTIPEGTQSGTEFVLKDKGIVYYNTRSYGSLHFTVVMETPRNLTPEAKDALRRFDELCKATSYSKKQKFTEKLARLFKKK
jgi:molecular chaperone DnaJ